MARSVRGFPDAAGSPTMEIANQETLRCTRLATWAIFGQKDETDVDALTEKNLKALAGRSIAHVNVRSPDVVELAVPESEGWRLVVSATTDKEGRPALGARWEPGLRHRRDPSVLRRIIHRPRRVTRHRSSCPRSADQAKRSPGVRGRRYSLGGTGGSNPKR